MQKGGIGTALLLACLEDMKHAGYGYAIIGGVGPAEYYAKAVGAVPIEGSDVGIYRGLLGAKRFGGGVMRAGASPLRGVAQLG